MEKLSPRSEIIAKKFASPIIMLILKPFSNEQLKYHIKDDVNLVAQLKANPDALSRLKSILNLIPSSKRIVLKALPNIRSKPWVRWFINNELAHKRPDLHAIFVYHDNAFDWLLKNMGKLSKYLEEQLG